MSIYEIVLGIDTAVLFGGIIGYSLAKYISKRKFESLKRKLEQLEFEEYKKAKINNSWVPYPTPKKEFVPEFPDYEKENTTNEILKGKKINEIQFGKNKIANMDIGKIIIKKEKIIKQNICKCGHELSEHTLDSKNKKACYHIIENISEDEDKFCECENYNP
jgi:hypothetical protein